MPFASMLDRSCSTLHERRAEVMWPNATRATRVERNMASPIGHNRKSGLNFGLSETADMLVDTVTAFAHHEIAPRAEDIDRSNTFPRDLWPKMGELGLHGITVEDEFGGS